MLGVIYRKGREREREGERPLHHVLAFKNARETERKFVILIDRSI